MTLETLITAATFVSIVVGIYVSLQKQAQTHRLVNSRMTELLELTRVAARAAGVKQEREDNEALHKDD